MAEKNKREIFIKNIGLDHDPFETPVAEQELARVQDVFYSYYSPSSPFPAQEDLIKSLRRPQYAFVYGFPGDGKSTLRLTLDADCRTILDGTLAVTYILGEDIEHPLSLDEHGIHLAKALAIDLTLALIEQFNPLNPFPTKKQIQALQYQVQVGGRQLKRLLRTLLEKLEKPEQYPPDPVWGISKDWNIIGKAPVKYLSGSDELRELLKKASVTNEVETLEVETLSGWDIFWKGTNAARKWGFTRFLVMVDGVDTKKRTSEAMMALIKPLLDMLNKAESENVFIKFFLPMELKENLQDYLQSDNRGLYSNAIFPIIEWDEKALRQLLAQRFRAASSRTGPRYTGLDSLAVPQLNLDEKVIRVAKGSPRRMLGIISKLIDIHVTRDPNSFRFSQEDWEKCQRKLFEDSQR